MLLIILCIFLATVHSHNTTTNTSHTHNTITYKFIHKYNNYTQLFKLNAGQNNVLDLTHLATGNQICENQMPCKFYVYLYEPQHQPIHTILITSGIHGNQKIGPIALLHAYPLLHPQYTRIIYFPIMNPSGYDLNQRNSYPEDLDLNRDFPIDKNIKCYQGSSTRIIDHLFRTYKIDLTVNLHNGGDEIGWNWGTVSHKKDPQTENQKISASIGNMLKNVGGQNEKLKIKKFKIGTMNQAIYPAVGTLDDWAYAGSWDQSVPSSCQNFRYKPYQKDMHSGLVFLFQLGKHNPQQSLLGTSCHGDFWISFPSGPL